MKPYDSGAMPDVVIQFSWKNSSSRKDDAIDDMMNRALETERGSPSGFLNKVRISKNTRSLKLAKGSRRKI